MNNGKRFENNFKKSVPEDVYYYRFRDGTSSWDKGEMTRFQQTNACDCMLYTKGSLFMLELKNHKGKSLPFSCIRDNQLIELENVENYDINGGFVVNFEDIGRCYYARAHLIKNYIEDSDRKSIPVQWFEENAIHIPSRKVRINYSYNLNPMFKLK